MPGLKQTAFAAAAAAALLWLPVTPAAAAGPLLFAPWVLGHVIVAGARLATLPLVAASAAVSAAQQPPAQYPSNPGYYGGPAGYPASPNYYAGPPAYYPPPPAYYPAPQAYYRPAVAYAPPMPQLYAQPRGYYPARMPYSGTYGARGFFHQSGGFARRGR
jgi:hypothetical protein